MLLFLWSMQSKRIRPRIPHFKYQKKLILGHSKCISYLLLKALILHVWDCNICQILVFKSCLLFKSKKIQKTNLEQASMIHLTKKGENLFSFVNSFCFFPTSSNVEFLLKKWSTINVNHQSNLFLGSSLQGRGISCFL